MKERTSTTEPGRPATLGELSHTNPYTDRSFGDAMVYERGPVVAADGGTAEADDDAEEPTDPTDDSETTEADRLKDIDHTPPVGDGANRVYERGGEHENGDEHEKGGEHENGGDQPADESV